MSATRITGLAGAYGLAMILGALGFQYLGGVMPCEMCHWQRWPLIAAAVVGLGGLLLVSVGIVDKKYLPALGWCALILIAISGAIGAYQAGVEWKFLPGPAACTGPRFVVTGMADLSHVHNVVRCDEASWRLFGISLAGYNALCSLGAAALGAFALIRGKS